MASEFESAAADVEPLRSELRNLEGLADNFGRAMTTAFRRSVVDGRRLQDVLKSLALGLSSRALNQALAPIGQGVGSLLTGLLGQLVGGRFAKGALIGRARPFAAGGVVASPGYFPMRGGLGLIGEAGPEAILPLARGSDGRLGVRAQGGGHPINVTFNVTTQDAASFRRAEAEVSAMLARAVARGRRGM